jgi:hypothetical protein
MKGRYSALIAANALVAAMETARFKNLIQYIPA